MTKLTKTVKVKKAVDNAVKKVISPKVSLTLKQARTIEALLAKNGKGSKVLSTKIAAFNA